MHNAIHPAFKLNGVSFDKEALQEVAYSFIKEGADFEVAIGDFLMDWLDLNDTITVQTSGSTGNAKQIQLQKEKMVQSALATAEYFGLCSGQRALLCLPASFIAGKMMLVRAMVSGLEIDCVAPSSNPLHENRNTYDFSAMVPLQLGNAIAAIDRIGTLLVGGAPLSDTIKDQVRAKKTRVFETYGMTETITHVATREIPKTDMTTPCPFRALPNVSFTKDDRECLVIDAPNIVDEKVVTNDVVKLLSAETFEWLGRFDFIINSGGVKLNPEQIEGKLRPYISGRFMVTGVPDAALGEKVVLVLEGEKTNPDLLKKIRTISALNKYETPKAIFYFSELLLTENGKIQRKKNRAFILE